MNTACSKNVCGCLYRVYLFEEWGGQEWSRKIFLTVTWRPYKYPGHILCVGRWYCLCLSGYITWVFRCLLSPAVSGFLPHWAVGIGVGRAWSCLQVWGTVCQVGLGLSAAVVASQLGIGRDFPKTHPLAYLRVSVLGSYCPSSSALPLSPEHLQPLTPAFGTLKIMQGGIFIYSHTY